MVFFTSDTHFCHSNIIKYCNRPFKDVNHMDHEMINRWNAIVEPDDTVYHLGDFAMGGSFAHPGIIRDLHGYKILIKGNHDKSLSKMIALGFNEALDIGQYNGWTLIHDPIGARGDVLCGHVHDKWLRHKDSGKDIINVGVDQWDFRPVTFSQLMGAPCDQDA